MKLTKLALLCALGGSALVPQFASADDMFDFHGYTRWGTSYEEDGNDTIGASGSTGNAIGRLGNEGNGGEWLFVKKFEPENGTKWEVGYMVDSYENTETHSYSSLGTKQSYASVSNVFAAQPDLSIWAGKVFHSRLQQGISDYYLSINDGQGTGVKNVDIGFSKMELGFVDSGSKQNYALTSTFNDIMLTDDIKMMVMANYGFANNENTDAVDAHQLIAKITMWGQNFYYRRAHNVENSLSWGREAGLNSDYYSMDGAININESTNVEYQFGVHDVEQSGEASAEDGTGDRLAYNVIVRPTYAWNDIHTTWVEAGYTKVDFDDESQPDNEAWKVTLSQNIQTGAFSWARPQIRFYVTAGEEKNNDVTSHPVIAGAMFEAWW